MSHHIRLVYSLCVADKIIIFNFTQDLNIFRQGKDLYYGVYNCGLVAIHPIINVYNNFLNILIT